MEQSNIEQKEAKEIEEQQTEQELQNDVTPQPSENSEPEQELNLEDTGLANLKTIAESKGIDFDEVQKSYVANNCMLTEELKQKCIDAGIPEDFINRAMEGVKALHDKEMNDVASVVGGRDSLNRIMEWGKNNLTAEEISDFQTDLSSNPSLTTAQAIVFYINHRMQSEEGKAPDYVQAGTGQTAMTDIFKSKAEAIKAFSDSRYDPLSKDYDETFAKEIEEKLERTNKANGSPLFG